MKVMTLTLPQILYIVIASVVVLTIVAIFIIVNVRKNYKRKKFKEYFYKKVYSIAFNQDYYLINHFRIRTADEKMAEIDHILFGDKYIYLIQTLRYDGSLNGSYDDKSFKYWQKNAAKYSYTDNPFVKSEIFVRNFSLLTGLSQSFFIGVTVVNDDCQLTVSSGSQQFYIVQRKKLASLIKQIESREVGKLNERQIDSAVKAIAKMNKNKKAKK